MGLQFLHDVEFVLEADRLLLRVVLLARRQLGAQLLRAHLQVQPLRPGLLVVVRTAVTSAVHVVDVAVAVFPHAGLGAAAAVAAGHGCRLRHGAAVAVSRVVRVDGLLRVLEQEEKDA